MSAPHGVCCSLQAHANTLLEGKDNELAQLRRTLTDQAGALEKAQVRAGHGRACECCPAVISIAICSFEITWWRCVHVGGWGLEGVSRWWGKRWWCPEGRGGETGLRGVKVPIGFWEHKDELGPGLAACLQLRLCAWSPFRVPARTPNSMVHAPASTRVLCWLTRRPTSPRATGSCRSCRRRPRRRWPRRRRCTRTSRRTSRSCRRWGGGEGGVEGWRL